jgi:hypothetical protein
LEVLAERSTDGRSTGRTLAVREGGEVRHKRPVVGKVKSDSASGGRKQERHLRSQILSIESHQTVWSARRRRRPEWCSSGWVPVASGDALAGKTVPAEEPYERIVHVRICGGRGYNRGATLGKARPYPERDATGVSIVRGGRRFCNFAGRQQLAEGAPVSGLPICGRSRSSAPETTPCRCLQTDLGIAHHVDVERPFHDRPAEEPQCRGSVGFVSQRAEDQEEAPQLGPRRPGRHRPSGLDATKATAAEASLSKWVESDCDGT